MAPTDVPVDSSPVATQHDPLLTLPLKYLQEAAQNAQQYLAEGENNVEVLSIHHNFIQQRITSVERAVQSINRRNKNDDYMIPEEAEKATVLLRDINVRKAQVIQEEKEREQAANAARETLNAANRIEAPHPENLQVIIKKPAVPPLQIPRFAGNPLDYHNFIAIFDSTIHNNDTLAPSQKLAYLQSYVEGEAKKIIGQILVTDPNYEIARSMLKSNYGQIEHSITLLYDKIHGLPKAKNDPFSIRDTFNEMQVILGMIEHAGVDVNNDKYLYHEILKKWPWNLIRQIVRQKDMGMARFRQELEAEVELQIHLTQAVGYEPPPSPSTSRKTYIPKPPRNFGNEVLPIAEGAAPAPFSQRRPMQCIFGCGAAHFAEDCTAYKTAVQRIQQIPDRCKRCFRKIHAGDPCIRNIKCQHCGSLEHNRALCPVRYGGERGTTLFTQETEVDDSPGYFITFLANIVNPETKESATIRILLDLASDRTAMTESAAQRIGIQTKHLSKRKTTGMGEVEVEPMTTETINIDVEVRDNSAVTIPIRITSKIASDVRVYDVAEFRQHYPHCNKYYIPDTGKGKPIDLILGSDKMLKFITLHDSVYVSETCQLLATKFGWLIAAENTSRAKTEALTLFTSSRDPDQLMQLMCNLELVGMKSLNEPQLEMEEKALKAFYESIKFENGRYEVHWPWRNYPPNLNENYGLAIGRLRSLYKKLSQQPQLLAAYNDIIQEQLNEEVVEDIPRSKESWGRIKHYIPHHAVIVPEKTTPVRIVYDGSATIAEKKSLNNNILKGTKWIGDMVESLLRFRKEEYAVSADIRRAFHQISIAPEDRDAVRFLWIYDINKPPQGANIRIMRFRRVAFGIVASPFLLYATIQYHLKQNPHKYTHYLSTEMYADNLLVSLPADTDTAEFYSLTKQTFNAMSMNITKWKTNSEQMNKIIPLQDKSQEEIISVLGLQWDAQQDEISLRTPKLQYLNEQTPTKRIVLRTLASIFDPLGWVAPFLILIRIFLRRLWQEKLTWDAPLQTLHIQEWSLIKKEIAALHTIKAKRKYFMQKDTFSAAKLQIHTFVDASIDAIGNVTYLRTESETDAQIAFVFAKARLTPESKLTIPRLELYAMAMGVRIQTYILQALKLRQQPEKFIWSDSKCVLAWVASEKLLPAAIEKHIKEIKNSSINHFRYVPTTLNPADIASRGMTLTELKLTSWLNGPEWLQQQTTWPKHIDTSAVKMQEELIENNKILFIQGLYTTDIKPPFNLNIQNFSTWKALIRRTAYCIRALNIIFKKQVIKVRTPIDYQKARDLWIRWDQRKNGSQNPQAMQNMTHLKRIQLFIDENGLTRCKSRLINATLQYESVQPTLLVKGSLVSQLIVLDIHQRNFHVGTAYTLAALRKHYWLPHGRREVFRIIHTTCFKCKRYNVKPFQAPPMPPLPAIRVQTPSYPFQNTGIDVFGPFFVYSTESQNKIKVKRWILLHTCLIIRAIHFEILTAMDTADILCAIKRFVARRGTPQCILSDNAPQFHLVRNCLVDLWTHFIQAEESNKYFAEKEIDWKFTPQSAPWMGGAYERLVQVTKNAFKRTYGEQTLTEREFNTTIIELEAVINNRPLTYVDQELGTPLLTPNHFLQVKYPALPITTNETLNQNQTVTRTEIMQYWKEAENSLNVYWKYWSEQYLLSLREIKLKITNQPCQPKVGDIVLMVDPSQRRGYWRTAQIERLIKSADGRIRSAQIRVSNGNRMIRPITKLASLELLKNLPEIDDDTKNQAKLSAEASVRREDPEVSSEDNDQVQNN